MRVIIMRGLPGAGKDTWLDNLRNLTPHGKFVICSADDFHMENGVYRFNPANVGRAHDECLIKFTHWICKANRNQGPDVLAVSNTNTQAWECAVYYRMAEAFGYKPEIIHLDCSFATSMQRNIHNVPAKTVWQMHQHLLSERLPAHWNITVIPEGT